MLLDAPKRFAMVSIILKNGVVGSSFQTYTMLLFNLSFNFDDINPNGRFEAAQDGFHPSCFFGWKGSESKHEN